MVEWPRLSDELEAVELKSAIDPLILVIVTERGFLYLGEYGASVYALNDLAILIEVSNVDWREHPSTLLVSKLKQVKLNLSLFLLMEHELFVDEANPPSITRNVIPINVSSVILEVVVFDERLSITPINGSPFLTLTFYECIIGHCYDVFRLLNLLDSKTSSVAYWTHSLEVIVLNFHVIGSNVHYTESSSNHFCLYVNKCVVSYS